MLLPPLSALAWRPRGNGVPTGMYATDDEDDFGTPAPPAPPSLLTEQQKEAVYQYIRGEAYEQYEWYLDDQYPGAFAEAHEKAEYNEMMREWQKKVKKSWGEAVLRRK